MTYLWSGMILAGIIYGIISGNMQAVTEAVVSCSREAVSLCISMAGITAMWTGLMKIAEMAGLVDRLAEKLGPVLHFLFPGLKRDSKACRYISVNFMSNFMGLNWAATPAGLEGIKELAKEEERRRKEERRCKEERVHEDEGIYEDKEIHEDKGIHKDKGVHEDKMIHINKGVHENIGVHKDKGVYKDEKVCKGGMNTSYKRRPTVPEGTASDEMCTFLIMNISSLQLIPVNIIAYRAQYGSVDPAAIVGPAVIATAVSTVTAAIFCKLMNRKPVC